LAWKTLEIGRQINIRLGYGEMQLSRDNNQWRPKPYVSSIRDIVSYLERRKRDALC
jgi:hypothetical protein